MDKSEVRRIVDENVEPMLTALGIRAWKVDISYGTLTATGTTRGRCRLLPQYMKAHIELDPETLDDEVEVLHVLRHELLHVVTAPWDEFRMVVRHMLREEMADAAEEAHWLAEEKLVTLIEGIMRRLDVEPDRLVEIGRELSGEPAPGEPAESPADASP